MPIYQYRCNACGFVNDVFMVYTENIPITQICPMCKGISSRIISAPNINVGVKSRVFYQWKGNPKHCPPELREALKHQDMPKGVSEFSKEGEPVLGTGSKFDPKG